MPRPITESLLSLVRLGIGNDSSIPKETIDWSILQALAHQQELSAMCRTITFEFTPVSGRFAEVDQSRFAVV